KTGRRQTRGTGCTRTNLSHIQVGASFAGRLLTGSPLVAGVSKGSQPGLQSFEDGGQLAAVERRCVHVRKQVLDQNAKPVRQTIEARARVTNGYSSHRLEQRYGVVEIGEELVVY